MTPVQSDCLPLNKRIMLEAFEVGQLYSNEEVFKALKVANAGGIRLSIRANAVLRAAIMTSSQGLHGSGENPYHDRLEGEILTYTAAGKTGEQTLAGINSRVSEQRDYNFPVHGFMLVASRRDKTIGARRWSYLGLLEYIRHYPDTQLDADGKVRKVWLFEFRIHQEPRTVHLEHDVAISNNILLESRSSRPDSLDDEVVGEVERGGIQNLVEIERIRGRLLVMDAKRFEFFIRDLLVYSGFANVCVTKYSADGGIDVTAVAGSRAWMFERTLVQVQAKRWLHSVGRKEVAELRGSMQPFAKGAVITTSHFSKAAMNEANEEGKNPISLIDGFRLSRVVIDEKFPF